MARLRRTFCLGEAMLALVLVSFPLVLSLPAVSPPDHGTVVRGGSDVSCSAVIEPEESP